ncbi:hypothetical protein [uncultured Microbulbifer sp.]|uniref:hypothetical protein n=1 Tax=uncultured Microbulbifer sp. TaxID=348147 RepID=UPI0025F21226|nr:hypothetical protein [uncultured Microbulbifer sp.]
MGGDSKSSSSQSSSQVDQTFNFVEGTGDGDRVNLALSEGASVGNITSTDYGAIDAAIKMNQGALDLGLTATEEAFATAQNFGALSFGALEENNQFASDTLAQAIGAITKSTEFASKQNVETIERGFELAMLNSRSEGEAVTTEGIKALKVVGGLAAAGIVVAAVVKNRKGK